MEISVYDMVSQSLFTWITIIASVGIVVYLWSRFRKKERGRYNR